MLSLESLEFLSYSSNSGVLIVSFKALEFLSYLSKHCRNSYKCLQICGANFPHLQPMAKFQRDQRGEIGRQHVKAHSCSHVHFSPCFDHTSPTQTDNGTSQIDHDIGAYVPFSFRTMSWILLRPLNLNLLLFGCSP